LDLSLERILNDDDDDDYTKRPRHFFSNLSRHNVTDYDHINLFMLYLTS